MDIETGVVRILKYSSAVHTGTPINPALCLGQSEGSVVMGTGVAMMEELKFAGGQPVNASFLDYHIPSILDIPDSLSPNLVTDAFETGPFGAKGMGEQDLPSVAPAIANAIFHACGIRLGELPFTPEKVLAMIKAQRE